MGIPLTLNFKVLEMTKEKEYLSLTIQSDSYNYNYNPNVKNINENIPFIYSKIDDIENDDLVSYPFSNKLYNCAVINKNIICEVLSWEHYSSIYRIYSDISNCKELCDKIYSLDYKLIVTYVTKDEYFFITLKYNPNMRKVKLLKIKEKIKQKNVI